MATGDSENSKIVTPDGLSASEREALVERARYEAFREKGTTSRALLQSLLAFIAVGVVAAGASVAVMPMLESSLLARAVFTGVVAGGWGVLSAYWISRDRANIINARIQEILQQEPQDDTLSTEESE